MSSVSGQSPTIEPKANAAKPQEVAHGSEMVEIKGKGQIDIFYIVWAAFVGTVDVNQKLAQTHADELSYTQNVEMSTNKVLASYVYANVSNTQMGSSWNPYFAQLTETNDRVQASVSITQNTMGVEQQTGQVQQTNANTVVQDAVQAMNQAFAASKELGSITSQISQV